MYEIYEKLRDAHGLTDYRVSRDTGIPAGAFSNWKAGRYAPKADKLLILADYFHVPVERFLRDGGKETN